MNAKNIVTASTTSSGVHFQQVTVVMITNIYQC